MIVQPNADHAFTIFAQAEDRSGFARGTLAPRVGIAGAVPPLDPRPLRSMADMGMGGMDHGAMDGTNMGQSAMPGMDHGTKTAASSPGMDHSSMPGMPGMDHSSMPGMSATAPSGGMPMDRGGMSSGGKAGALKESVVKSTTSP